MPWRKPKKKPNLLDYVPWHRRKVDVDSNGNRTEIKTPFEVITSELKPAKIFAAFPNYIVLLIGICIGGYLGMSADRAAIQANPEAAACMRRAGESALERMIEQNAWDRRMAEMNMGPKAAAP